MADSVQTLLDEIKSVVDVTDAEALTALNRRHRRMVARARALRKTVTIGTTTAGTDFYAAPAGIVELLVVYVDGVPFGQARHPDKYGYAQGTLVFSAPGGLVIADADASGVTGLTLVPAPTSSGLTITGFAAVLPADLAQADAASAIKVDADFYDDLVAGAAATFLSRAGEGDPGSLEAQFASGCEELRRRVSRRLRGAGPSQIRVQGINA